MSTPAFPPMEYVRLGHTGLKVSRICLGCMSFGDPAIRKWALTEEQSDPIVKRALDLGINFFDTANAYSYGKSEEITGHLLKKYAKREDYVLASKVFFGLADKPTPNGRGLSRKHIMEAIDASLKRLGTDYIDLYQIHRWDYETPIEETMEALHDVVKSGKVHYIGASSMHAWQFAKAQAIAQQRGFTQFVSMQNHYNLIYREEEREMIPYCKDQGIGLIPWSPLARGLLTRPSPVKDYTEAGTARSSGDPFTANLYGFPETKESEKKIIDRANELATKKGIPAAQISLAWMLSKPHVTAPIIGVTKMHHLEDAVAAVGVKLTPEEITYLEEPYTPRAVRGHQ